MMNTKIQGRIGNRFKDQNDMLQVTLSNFTRDSRRMLKHQFPMQFSVIIFLKIIIDVVKGRLELRNPKSRK